MQKTIGYEQNRVNTPSVEPQYPMVRIKKTMINNWKNILKEKQRIVDSMKKAINAKLNLNNHWKNVVNEKQKMIDIIKGAISENENSNLIGLRPLNLGKRKVKKKTIVLPPFHFIKKRYFTVRYLFESKSGKNFIQIF